MNSDDGAQQLRQDVQHAIHTEASKLTPRPGFSGVLTRAEIDKLTDAVMAVLQHPTTVSAATVVGAHILRQRGK